MEAVCIEILPLGNSSNGETQINRVRLPSTVPAGPCITHRVAHPQLAGLLEGEASMALNRTRNAEGGLPVTAVGANCSSRIWHNLGYGVPPTEFEKQAPLTPIADQAPPSFPTSSASRVSVGATLCRISGRESSLPRNAAGG